MGGQHHSTSFYIILQDLVVMNVTFPDAAGVVGISRPRIKNPRRNEEKDSVDAVETTAKRVAEQSEECLSPKLHCTLLKVMKSYVFVSLLVIVWGSHGFSQLCVARTDGHPRHTW